MHSNIELIVVRNPMSYACDNSDCKIVRGDDLFELVTSIYPKGMPPNTYWYHEKWDTDCDVTPEKAQDIIALNDKGGSFYIVTYPAGPETWIPILVSAFITVAAVLLMPMPVVPTSAANAPPSPNNALAQRTNRQRQGGRIADIYGQVWSVPDLVAVTYTVYINNRAIEMSYMVIGRGWYLVTEALDDTTPIDQVFGSGVLIFNPDSTLDDTPAYQFGSAFTPDEAALSRLTTKRYTSVNGQLLPPTDNYLTLDKAVFRAGGIIEQPGFNFVNQFKVGDALTVVQTNPGESANGITDPVDQGEPPANPPIVGPITTYSLSGVYTISALSEAQITLSNPASINPDWQKLSDNADYTVEQEATISTQSSSLWQGYFYTSEKDHEFVMVNFMSSGGLYITDGQTFEPIGIEVEIESEIVDVTNNPVPGTLQLDTHIIYGSKYDKYANNNGLGTWRDNNYWWSGAHVSNPDAAQTAASTIKIENIHMSEGKRLRWRARRKHGRVRVSKGFSVVQDIRIADFYGAKLMGADYSPPGFTKVYSKTLATEGALSLKERKLTVLAQRLERDWQNNDALIPSKRIDDIIYDIATDPVTSNLTADDLDMAQIKAEVDAQIAYFGTDLCAQFCGTFDSKDITTEEMIQTVAMAGFFTAYRINNKVCLHFERPEAYPVATFNSHSITPDSFEYSESFGPRNDYDGIEVTYTDPVDDAKVTLCYPEDGSATNPDTKNKDLVGVRNKVQAHMHMMRRHWKNQHAYKTCSFTAADESGIVLPTNQINVADQYRADTQQGAVEALQVNGTGEVVLTLSDSVDFGGKAQATVFVQTVAGIVDNIRCMPSTNPREVILTRAPSQPISTSWDAVVRATYQLVLHDDLDRDNYIVTTKDPGDNPMSHRLSCINYTDKYYPNDKDFINGLIT